MQFSFRWAFSKSVGIMLSAYEFNEFNTNKWCTISKDDLSNTRFYYEEWNAADVSHDSIKWQLSNLQLCRHFTNVSFYWNLLIDEYLPHMLFMKEMQSKLPHIESRSSFSEGMFRPFYVSFSHPASDPHILSVWTCTISSIWCPVALWSCYPD